MLRLRITEPAELVSHVPLISPAHNQNVPQNSMTEAVPPAVPILPMTWRMTSLELTPGASSPSTCILMFLLLLVMRHWVASTCSTSLVPMPKARAPKAPCVDVWLSPQTTVVPGRVKPCSGPMTWTIPCRLSLRPKYVMPKSLTFSSRVTHCVRESSSWMKLAMSLRAFLEVVGTFWRGGRSDMFAKGYSGRHLHGRWWPECSLAGEPCGRHS